MMGDLYIVTGYHELKKQKWYNVYQKFPNDREIVWYFKYKNRMI